VRSITGKVWADLSRYTKYATLWYIAVGLAQHAACM
jgi:hypothetical protein